RRIWHLISGDDCRSHRTEAIKALPQEPLLVPGLDHARGYIVGERVTEDMIECSLARNAASATADYNNQLAFIIDGIGFVGAGRNWLATGDNRCVRLAEDRWIFRNDLSARTGVEAA